MNHPFHPDPALVHAVRTWLGEDGLRFFRETEARHGSVLALVAPMHHTHSHEGRAVRNKLRELTNYAWTAHEYDERWVPIVEAAISQGNPRGN